MANVSGAVQIETGIKHGLSIPFQSVAGEQSIDVGTLLTAPGVPKVALLNAWSANHSAGFGWKAPVAKLAPCVGSTVNPLVCLKRSSTVTCATRP